ncbi:MAG: tellurite resistance protein TerC [Solirubrobacteraceae bacterium]|nr:tellurite resistance protein TerC [Solirubrobacteraceae bacterium]
MIASTLASSPGAWLALVAAIVVLLAVDLLAVRGRGGEMGLRFAALASVTWVAIALAFAGVLLLAGERGAAGDYLAGYLVEKSLSLDNVFVFLLVFSGFGVAERARHRLLTYGIAGALVLRAGFIVAGAAALGAASWIAFVFAGFLVYTGVKMLRHRHDHGAEAALVDRLKARFPLTDEGAGEGRFMARRDGRRMLTTGGAALAAIAIVDVLFAVDSVPAILAITGDAFVVFAANAFALLGLRPLFFLVAELVARLYYLKTALALLLVFIGAKMAASELFGKIGPEYSLPGIAAILGTGVVASLVRDRRQGEAAPGPA